ncbi:MAG: hypothetical protein AAB573_00385 [Patescibacteria group bacterium]
MARGEEQSEYPFSPSREWHFLKNLFDRFGIVLSRAEVDQLKNDLKSGIAPLRVKGPTGAHNYYARIQGQMVPVVYKEKTDRLITALPRKDIAKHEHAPVVQRQSPDDKIFKDTKHWKNKRKRDDLGKRGR